METPKRTYWTQETFIERAKEIHTNPPYDYSMTEFITVTKKINIICPLHGIFQQLASNHLRGQSCQVCASDKKRKSPAKFVEEARAVHGDKYNYDKSVYHQIMQHVIITCSKHGDFKQTPHHHIEGRGCPDCSSRALKDSEKFIEDAKVVHGSQYTYEKVDYKGSELSLVITCQTHGDFTQRAKTHLEGHGCPSCINKTEGIVFNFINTRFDSCVLNFRPIWSRNPENNYLLPFDMIIEEFKLIIEVDGDQHFKQLYYMNDPKEVQKRDIWKMKKALENGYSLIRLPQIPAFKGGDEFLQTHILPLCKLHTPSELFYITPESYEGAYDDHKRLMA
jgi:hypothetical protein